MQHERYSPNYFFESYLGKTKYKDFAKLNLRDWDEFYKIGRKNIAYIFQILQEIIKFLAENVNNKSADIWCSLSDNITFFIDPVDNELDKTKNMVFVTEMLLGKLKTRVTEIEDLQFLSRKSREIKENLKKITPEDLPIFPIFRNENYFSKGKVMVLYLPYFLGKEFVKTESIWQVKAIGPDNKLNVNGVDINPKCPGVMELSEFKFLQEEFRKNIFPSGNVVFTWAYNSETQGPVHVEQFLRELWRDRGLNLNEAIHRQAAISQANMPTLE